MESMKGCGWRVALHGREIGVDFLAPSDLRLEELLFIHETIQ
jgi:hypothetical protein